MDFATFEDGIRFWLQSNSPIAFWNQQISTGHYKKRYKTVRADQEATEMFLDLDIEESLYIFEDSK